jgi:coenzyme F420-0:L-glutamate ligase/coenzyme F420-1:gamma-L-glutamate ligase
VSGSGLKKVKSKRNITIYPVTGIPLVELGDDLSGLLISALIDSGIRPHKNDILVVTHKVVSKAEGNLAILDGIKPSAEATEIARATEKDPRHVQLILDDSVRVVRKGAGVLVTEHRGGWICANAGVDFSNAPGALYARLPEDPDRSAAAIRNRLVAHFDVPLGVIISDSHGRPFRLGVIGVAIGVAGLPGLLDRNGERDLFGYTLKNTHVALADLIASAALLVMGEGDEGIPAALIRGVTFNRAEGSGRELIRSPEMDLFR